jgi:hypothetical protein
VTFVEGKRVENQMGQFKATANAHMQRDLKAGPKWVCTCEACHAVRSLVGMDKSFAVRQLVRRILDIEERLYQAPSASAKKTLLDRYLRLYDQLAEEMGK